MKKFLISMLIAMVLILTVGGTVLAAGPTDVVSVDWTGSGSVNGNINATGDVVYSFSTTGNAIGGSFVMTNYLDNPYGYQVNSTKSELISHVSGGSTTYTTTRTDSYPMYGAAGQNTFSFIGASPDS